MVNEYIKEFNISEEDQRYIGSNIDYRSVAFEKFEDKEVCCEICGKTIKELEESNKYKTSRGYNFTKTLVVHHKDMRSSNDKYYHIDNRPENLLVLCPSCHTGIHSTGRKVSEDIKRKISESTKGEKNPFYGKSHSEDAKRRMSEAHRSENLSEETKRKMRESQIGKTHSTSTREKMSEAQKGAKNHFYGKTHSEESREKMSEALKGRRWYNDGLRSYQIEPGDP